MEHMDKIREALLGSEFVALGGKQNGQNKFGVSVELGHFGDYPLWINYGYEHKGIIVGGQKVYEWFWNICSKTERGTKIVHVEEFPRFMFFPFYMGKHEYETSVEEIVDKILNDLEILIFQHTGEHVEINRSKSG